MSGGVATFSLMSGLLSLGFSGLTVLSFFVDLDLGCAGTEIPLSIFRTTVLSSFRVRGRMSPPSSKISSSLKLKDSVNITF